MKIFFVNKTFCYKCNIIKYITNKTLCNYFIFVLDFYKYELTRIPREKNFS